MPDQDFLLGRGPEQTVIAEVLGEVERHGAAVVLSGAPGVGKTALLEWAVHKAGSAFRVLRAAGTPLETDLPFAALHQLLRPVLTQVRRVPAPRLDVLESAFGGMTPTRVFVFAVAMAALDVLADVAADDPVLVLVDDVQWMDPVSAQVLVFVARRLQCDRIVLLSTELDGALPSMRGATSRVLELEPLDPDSAAEVLDRAVPSLEPALRSAILETACGNPLALLELPRSGDVGYGAGESWTPLTARLESSFLARVDVLDAAARTTIQVAALSDSDDVQEVVAAAALLRGVPGADEGVSLALERAAAAGLLDVDASVFRFRHPLIRSAVYQRTRPADRRAAHTALAQVLSGRPERRTWHRAAATAGPDGSLAQDLESVAERALDRGSTLTAARALERSAQLSSDTDSKRRRLFRAASLAYEVGQADVGDRVRRAFRNLIDDEHDRLQVRVAGRDC